VKGKISPSFALIIKMLLIASLLGCTKHGDTDEVSATPVIETEAHWLTNIVVAKFWRAGEAPYTYFSYPPDVVVYADGRQIILHDGYLYEKQLANHAMCEILTEIDHSGFFEYTSEQYEQLFRANQMKPGPENYFMGINAWKSASLRLSSFGFLFSRYKEMVQWPDALRVPYERLTFFDPNSMYLYVPDRVSIHIEENPDLGTNIGVDVWRIGSPTLDELISRYHQIATPQSEDSEGEMIISGAEARAVLEQFNNRPWGEMAVFIVRDERYLVAARSLLPYENGGGVARPLIPDPNSEHLQVSMSCSEH
jgi:hypothetical protein